MDWEGFMKWHKKKLIPDGETVTAFSSQESESGIQIQIRSEAGRNIYRMLAGPLSTFSPVTSLNSFEYNDRDFGIKWNIYSNSFRGNQIVGQNTQILVLVRCPVCKRFWWITFCTHEFPGVKKPCVGVSGHAPPCYSWWIWWPQQRPRAQIWSLSSLISSRAQHTHCRPSCRSFSGHFYLRL